MIGYLAANDGTVAGKPSESADGIMSHSGRNVGNLAFWHVVRRLFDDEVSYIPWKTTGGLPQKLKALVIPAANFIGAHANLAPLTQIIRALDVPTLVLGLGAQSESENTLPPVDDSVKQFLSEASRCGPALAVRGEYSARVCRAFGIANVKVLGCPSVLMNGRRDLGEFLEARISRFEPDNVAVHAACRKGNLTTVERELVRIVQLQNGSAYIVQRPPELVAAIFREDLPPAHVAYLADMARFLGMSGGAADLTRFLRRYGHVPTSIDAWRSFLRRFSCAVNTRIHGTIVALQTGIPALCICHDTRTRELAVTLKIPAVDVGKFVELRYELKRLFLAAEFDGAAFDENRRRLAREYVMLFETVGLTPSAHLRALAKEPAAGIARAA